MATNNAINAPLPLQPSQGGTGVSNPPIHSIPIAEAGAPFNFVGPLTNGQVLIGSTGLDPVPNLITGSGGIVVTPGAGTINISGTGGGISWTDVTGTSQVMAPDNGYVADNGGLVTLTLPAIAAFGSVLSIAGKGAGGWIISQNAGQNIQIGNVGSSIGVGGSVASTNRWDSLNLVCVTANTVWVSLGGPQSAGLTIV